MAAKTDKPPDRVSNDPRSPHYDGEALERLAKKDPRQAKIVELRFFGGLSVEEAAEVLHVHPNTVIRDWDLARKWLKREMTRGNSTNAS